MEIKASIPGWSDYMVTDQGTVLSYKGKGRVERVLKVHNGAVSLRRGGHTYTRSVRSLMKLALWESPETTHHARSCRRCHAVYMARWRAKKRATATESG